MEVTKIVPNKNNPRGPNVREGDPHRENLKESMAEFGILVPLVLRRLPDSKYEIVDGERRYWVAQALRLKEVPAFVLEGDLADRAVLQRMFQIHLNRDEWNAVQQCKAAEGFYQGLVQKHEGDVEAMTSEFARFTGTDLRTARNRIQFLRWPKMIKDQIYSDQKRYDSYWYVVEIEDKIIEPALKNFPEYFEKVDVNDVRKFLYEKWEHGVVRAAVDVRRAAIIVRTPLHTKRDRRKALKILDRLVKEVEYSYEDAFESFTVALPKSIERTLPKPRALVNSIRKLTDTLSQYEPQYVKAYGKGSAILNELLEVVQDLRIAARAFVRRMRS